MKKDIENRDDLLLIVREFYTELFKNEYLKHFFEDFEKPSVLEQHLSTLVDFWDNTLFYSGTYKKNAMKPHILLHEHRPIMGIHFEQWLSLLGKAIDKNFAGPHAETMKNRALSIATVMKLKLGVH